MNKLIIFIILGIFTINLAIASPSHRIFGFSQADYTTSTSKKAPYGFQLRRINLITNFEPSEKVTVLADVEYEGSASLNTGKSSKGKINLSRAYIEYGISKKLNFRVGKYLSAFGLYNEIHDFAASYYLIDAPRLYQNHQLFSSVDSRRIYSKYSTGIQLYGDLFPNKAGGFLHYSLSLSNGSDENLQDGSDINKSTAFTFRTYYRPSFYGLQFGLSYHREKMLTGIGGIDNDLSQTILTEIEYENQLLLIQFETAMTQFKNPSKNNQTSLFSYIHVAYLKFEKLIPFIEFAYELNDLSDKNKIYEETILGLSWSITSQLFLKGEFIQQNTEVINIESSDKTLKFSINAMF